MQISIHTGKLSVVTEASPLQVSLFEQKDTTALKLPSVWEACRTDLGHAHDKLNLDVKKKDTWFIALKNFLFHLKGPI